VPRRDPPEKVVYRVGRRVAELRRGREWTQEQLAEKLGTSVQWVSRIEGGTVNLTIHTLVGLGRVLDVEITELFASPGPEPARRPRKDAGRPGAKRTATKG
jgi:transcriptional regulator with XRE-family HTH domain